MSSSKNTPFGIVRHITNSSPQLIGLYPDTMERNTWLQWHRENAPKDHGVSFSACDLIPDPLKK